MGGLLPLPSSEPISQCGMSGTDSLTVTESWEGMVVKFSAAKKEPILIKEEQVPRPLKHGQDKQRRLHPATKVLSLPWKSSTLCPHTSVTSCSLHSAGHCHLPKAFSVCHQCQVPKGGTVCTKYREAALHKNEQTLLNLQRGRFTGDSTGQFAKNETCLR